MMIELTTAHCLSICVPSVWERGNCTPTVELGVPVTIINGTIDTLQRTSQLAYKLTQLAPHQYNMGILLKCISEA